MEYLLGNVVKSYRVQAICLPLLRECPTTLSPMLQMFGYRLVLMQWSIQLLYTYSACYANCCHLHTVNFNGSGSSYANQHWNNVVCVCVCVCDAESCLLTQRQAEAHTNIHMCMYSMYRWTKTHMYTDMDRYWSNKCKIGSVHNLRGNGFNGLKMHTCMQHSGWLTGKKDNITCGLWSMLLPISNLVCIGFPLRTKYLIPLSFLLQFHLVLP